MISVLLIILKIIGIVLLSIVGLIFLLCLLVLFVPVRYWTEGRYEETFYCTAKVTWLLHFISVKIKVEENVTTTIRILGIPLSVFVRQKDSETTGDKESDLKASGKETTDVTATSDMGKETTSTNNRSTVAEETQGTKGQDLAVETVADPYHTSATKDADKKSLFDKVLDKVRSIIEKVKDVLNRIRNIFAKIIDFFQNVDSKKKTLKRYLVILKSDTVKAAFAVCKKRLFIMLKHIFPRKMLVNIHYGLDEPANTGYILGVYGVLPKFIGERIVLHPDFENSIFKCDFHAKGAIRMWTLMYQLLRVVFDENCRKLYYIVKKEISNERK